MGGLGWEDLWEVVALMLFVIAMLIYADYVGSIMQVSRLQ